MKQEELEFEIIIRKAVTEVYSNVPAKEVKAMVLENRRAFENRLKEVAWKTSLI